MWYGIINPAQHECLYFNLYGGPYWNINVFCAKPYGIWQVPGIRHDKYADAHRVVPEVQKETQFKGHYLHAAEWGQPANKSFDAVTNPQTTNNTAAAQR